jgi:hypothetical protein
MYNGIDPGSLSVNDRLDEIAKILAAGLTCLWGHKSSTLSAVPGDSCVDFPADQRRHANQSTKTKA